MKHGNCGKHVVRAGAIAVLLLFASSTTTIQASAEYAMQDPIRNQANVHAQATVSGTDETLLVHSATPSKNTVCSSTHGQGDVVVKYDDNETNISPGHCALLEAGQIRVRGANEDTHTHVRVHDHQSHSP